MTIKLKHAEFIENILAVLLGLSGVVIIYKNSNLWLVFGLFLWFWSNNIQLKTNKKKVKD